MRPDEPRDRAPGEPGGESPDAFAGRPSGDAPTEYIRTDQPDSPWAAPQPNYPAPGDPDWAQHGPPRDEVFQDAAALPAERQPPMPGEPDPGAQDEAEPREVPPAVVASGLTLTTKRGPIFQDVALTVPPATIAAIVGPSGTGRTSLLLALTGRMKQLSGNLAVAGHSLADEPAAVRAFTSVARIGHEIEPEPSLTIAESVRERCLLEKVPSTAGRERFATACEVIGLDLPPNLLVGDLGGDHATLLALALAAIPVTAVIVLDDIDRGVDGVTQYRLLDAVAQLAETGPAVVFTTTDRLRVAGVPVIVDMPLLSVQPVPVAPPAELVLEDAELSRRELSEAAAWRQKLERGRTDESIDADPDAGDLRAADEVPRPAEAWGPQESPEASGFGQPPQNATQTPQWPPPQDPPPDDGATTAITPEDRR